MRTAIRFLPVLLLLGVLFSCKKANYTKELKTDKNGYSYEQVTNDPLKTRIYTLKNGLTVYLSVNRDEPRAMGLIGVRAGSINDPAETTGLAHYLEHMMFKGTDHFGTTDWASEKVLLDSISNLFEKYKAEVELTKKKEIYKEIDRVSQAASKFAIPNEYDKMSSSIGSKSTNAFTNYDVTAYMNDIPVNELKKWVEMECDRFRNPVLRLFHTELETVYEEFNMYQDMDDMRLNNALMKGLFPTNPLGRDIIGFPEHLKNPSMVNIMKFYRTWYVPNNMVFVLSGDIDYEETIKLIDSTFGKFESKELPKNEFSKEAAIISPVIKEVVGPEAEQVQLAFRFNGYHSDDRKYVTMIDYILTNSVAGLIDLDLNQQQKVLQAGSTSNFEMDYGYHLFFGKPRQGQKLEEVRDLLLAEIEKVKRGEFDDWLIQATINNLKLGKIRRNESNYRAFTFLEAFIKRADWATELDFNDQLSKITKAQLVEFAKANYKDNHVEVFKRTGVATDLVKVEKPLITTIAINRADQSAFLKTFVSESVTPLEPVFVNYAESIKEEKLNENVNFDYIPNTTNDLFSLNYIAEVGSNHDPKLALAVKYLPYLGTDKYTAEQFKKELYKLGVSLNVNTGNDRSYVTIGGLDQNCEAGLKLLEQLLAEAKPDKEAYNKLVEGILKEREDQKKDQNAIGNALQNFGKYGKDSPFTNILSEETLKAIDPKELTEIIHKFCHYPHRVFYYGPTDLVNVTTLIKNNHLLSTENVPIPVEKPFVEQLTDKNNVFFVDYDKSQVDIVMMSRDLPFNPKTLVKARTFNEYYGNSMSSVVFQEIREARALAYSAWANYLRPSKKEDSFYIYGYVGTQANKMMDAIGAMNGLFTKMIVDEKSFNIAKESVIKSIQTERIIKSNIFWNWLQNKKLGIDYDIRKDYYEAARNTKIDSTQLFFDQHFKDKKYTYMIVGSKKDVDLVKLKTVGPVNELALKDIFNY
ncbi:MAG TPA: insulinase family protein [Prolixibacteraceae bacterium]|nr:insulinase family protein [Prolixibacteraceae bacterium]